jgi:regulatory protein
MAWGRSKKPVADEDRSVTDREKSRERTLKRAVTLLAAKPRSSEELRIRLLEKAWTDREIVDEVIKKLEGYKYVDDEQYARDFAAARLRERPQGKRRLQQLMGRQKLPRQLVEQAIEEAFEARPEDELIDTAIAKRLRLKGRPETREDVKKFYDHLMRQGFGFDLIRDKVSAITGTAIDEEGNADRLE